MRRFTVIIGVALLSLAYIGLALDFLNDPLIADEIFFVQAADNLSRDGVPITRGRENLAMFSTPDFSSRLHTKSPEVTYALWHPPLYIYAMAAIFRFAGAGAMQARLLGLASFIGTLVGIYLLSQEVFMDRIDRRRIGLLSCLVFGMNPMAIQGSLIVDIDNTLLTAAITVCLLAILKLMNSHRAANDVAAGLLFILLFWIKLTTPVGLLFSLLVFLALRDGISVSIRRIALILIIGGGGFLLSWSFYAWQGALPFRAPFQHLTGSFFSHQPEGHLPAIVFDVGFNGARLALWMSPFLLLTWWIALMERASAPKSITPPHALDLLHIFSLVVLGTYLYVGRTIFSFPRFHYPLLPILSIIAAGSFSNQAAMARANRWRVIASGVLAIFLILVGGDPLLSTYHQIKERLVAVKPLTDVVWHLMVQMTTLALTPLLVHIFCRFATRRPFRQTVMLPLAISTFAYCIALDVSHVRASYLVRYGYGGTGTAEAISFLKQSTTPGDFIFAPAELVYGLQDSSAFYPSNNAWTSEEALTNVLSERRTRAFAYGIPTNSTAQLKFVTANHTLASLLETQFQKHVIGSYTIWVRRP